jgi:hypothetical protein
VSKSSRRRKRKIDGNLVSPPLFPMIERSTPIGPPATIPMGPSSLRAAYPAWSMSHPLPLDRIMELKRQLGKVRYGPAVALENRMEYVDVPGVDRKVMPPELGGPADPVTQPGWLPQPIDDVVAMLVETRHTPQAQVIRGRECHYASDIDMLLMPFGKGTLAGPRDWVVAASEQLDEAYYEAWGMS